MKRVAAFILIYISPLVHAAPTASSDLPWSFNPFCAARVAAFVALRDLPAARFSKHGFEILPTPLLPAQTAQAALEAFLVFRSEGNSFVSFIDGRLHVSADLPPEERLAIGRLEANLTALVADALARIREVRPDYRGDARVNIRWSGEGLRHPTHYDHGHVDGGFAAIVATYVGPSSLLVLSGYEERAFPQGRSVLMTGQEGERAWNLPGTWHKAPNLDHRPARLFVQIVF